MMFYINILGFVNEKIVSPTRWNYLAKRICPLLADCKTILDFGAGDGGLIMTIQKQLPGIKVSAVDVHEQTKPYLPIIKITDRRLPFEDGTFDCVLISDVLHHDNNMGEMVEEARRVTNKYVLIKDHYYCNKIDFLLLKWADSFGNTSYGVDVPAKYLKYEEWMKLFTEKKLRLVNKDNKFRYNPLDTCKHVLFLLEKYD